MFSSSSNFFCEISSWETTLGAITAQQDIGTAGVPGAWPDMDVLTTGGQVRGDRKYTRGKRKQPENARDTPLQGNMIPFSKRKKKKKKESNKFCNLFFLNLPLPAFFIIIFIIVRLKGVQQQPQFVMALSWPD
jgi:hypothetical protein